MKSEGKKRFIPCVRRIREATGLSIRQLATNTGVDRTKISRWERGEGVRMIREAIIVARALDTSVEDLFDRDPDTAR